MRRPASHRRRSAARSVAGAPHLNDMNERMNGVSLISFSDLGLLPALERAVRDAGYTEPTPIQAQAIPSLLEGHDLLGCAKTGTGKTAAFALPILQHLASAGRPARAHTIRCLVLVPTRELAAQVAEA